MRPLTVTSAFSGRFWGRMTLARHSNRGRQMPDFAAFRRTGSQGETEVLSISHQFERRETRGVLLDGELIAGYRLSAD